MLVKIPAGFKNEREYLISTVFREFLGLEFDTVINSDPVYEIVLPNNNSIFIEDHFFSKFNKATGYLDKQNIPLQVSYLVNQFTLEKNIPVIFGIPELEINNLEKNNIRCRWDIFADIYFMLTRWEEYVTDDKDEYGRFPEKKALTIRNGIHRRPVVNEAVEMLWNIMKFLGYAGSRKKKNFEAVITHDVDEIIRNKNILKLFRILAGDLVLRKKPSLIFSSAKEYINVRSGKKKDNYDTFDFLMELSEKIGVKSHFFFLSQKIEPGKNNLYSNYDYRYNIADQKVVSIIRNIRDRGHSVGIHGSYNSYNNTELLSREINSLKAVAGDICESRQHYLRFSPPVTWEIESQNNIKIDYTLGFAEEIGFRCGICSPYPVFDFLRREPLALVELPLTVMEGAVLFLTKDPDDFYTRICSVINTVKKFEGKFVLLWHTNTFNGFEWDPYQKYYSEIINYLGTLQN